MLCRLSALCGNECGPELCKSSRRYSRRSDRQSRRSASRIRSATESAAKGEAFCRGGVAASRGALSALDKRIHGRSQAELVLKRFSERDCELPHDRNYRTVVCESEWCRHRRCCAPDGHDDLSA